MSRRGMWALASCLVMIFCSQAVAGPLATDSNAYVDEYSFQWCGWTDLASGTLSATIDWCVYGPGDYTGDYAAEADEFVYAYQVIGSGTTAVSAFSVGMMDSNEANDIDIDASLVDGTEPFIWYFLMPPPNLDSATWEFDGLTLGESSVALVFSSVNAPTFATGSIVDGGAGAEGDVPSPSNVIPEPGTIGLLLAGLALSLRRRRA